MDTRPWIHKLAAQVCGMAVLRRDRGSRSFPQHSFDAFPEDARSDLIVRVMAAPSAQDVAIGLPLIVYLGTILGTIVIHGFAVISIVHFIRHQHRVGHIGLRFWQDVAIVCTTTLVVGAAHLFEMTIWAMVFVCCGEFTQLAGAFYHSATNYTT